MERVTVHVDERQCNSWRLLNLRGLFILICLSVLCVDRREIILWGELCPTHQDWEAPVFVWLAFALVGNIFALPAPGKKTHSAGRVWRRENPTGYPAWDIWEPPGCRHCVFRARSIQKPNTGQYRAHGQVLPTCWSDGMWLCPSNPFTAWQDCHRTGATFTGGDVMMGLFSGNENVLPERSSHDGKSKSTQQKQLVVYKYWCIWIRAHNSEQAPGEFTSKSTHFAKVAFWSGTAKLPRNPWETKAQLSFIKKWVTSLTWERSGAGWFRSRAQMDSL